jgi:hypothetical protein
MGIAQPLLTTIGAGSTPSSSTQVWQGTPNSPVLIQNLSDISSVYLGYTPQVSPNGLNIIVLGPQQSVQMDGTRALWATSLTELQLNVIPNALAMSNQQVSTQSNITVLSQTSTVLAGNISGVFSQAYPPTAEGYQLEVIPANPGTRIFAVDLSISHQDAANNIVAYEQVTLSNWQNIGTNPSIVRGKLFGTTLRVQANVAASSWLNTITGGSVVADNISVIFCAIPDYIPGSGRRVPIITAGDALWPMSNIITLGAVSGVVTFGGVMPDFTGPVIWTSWTTFGGGFAFIPVIRSYTVSEGTPPYTEMRGNVVNDTTPFLWNVSLPSMFNTVWIEQDSTVANTAGVAIIPQIAV